MNELITKIKELSDQYFDEICDLRHHIHSNPELSFQEFETADFVEKKLQDFGIKNVKRISKTGITFLLLGKNPGKIIALRADLDALPITEQNVVSYKSKNKGVMHACGHDVHTASLLGTAKILNELKNMFDGTIKFIFQPGEEKSPGGASILIKDGVLKDPKPNSILGQHVMPLIPVGKVGFRSGKYMASADEIYLTIKGKGGHAAMPETLIDPVLITSHILVALQQIVSRRASPKMPSVLSFGYIEGKGATNVIPEQVRVEGTFRTFDETWREEALKQVRKMATGVAEAMGATCEVRIEQGYPYLTNEPAYTDRNIEAAKTYLGAENVEELDLWMAAEDFSFYSHHLDACFYRLGTRNEVKNIVSGVHTPTFDIDEEALKVGMGLMSWLTISELSR